MKIPHHGSKREASARLLDAYVRSKVHYQSPVPPYQPGLLASNELEGIVEAIADELKRNSEAAEEKQRRHEVPIIKMARKLGLDPRPAGHNDQRVDGQVPAGFALDNDIGIAQQVRLRILPPQGRP